MAVLKLSLLSIIFLLYYVKVCESSDNYTIGFEGYARGNKRPHQTNPPKISPTRHPNLNPTYRPTSIKPSVPKPNPTHRPRPNPTYPPSKPNPTYRPPPPLNANSTRPAPSKPIATNKLPKTTQAPFKTTSNPPFKRTTRRPVGIPKPTSPVLWNIWSSNFVPSPAKPSFGTKAPTNTFKSDATLLGLYTLMKNVVEVTLSQTGQSKPIKKPLRESYPYYYAVHHYNRDREKVQSRILVPYDSIGYCDAGTSDRTCVPGTYALCLLDWTIMCVTYSTATFPCYFNTSLHCATGKTSCDSRDPVCASMGNQAEVQTPCISNVVVTSSSAIMGSITQTSSPNPYAAVVSGPIDLCATTILEMKRLESPVGAIFGFLTELEKLNRHLKNNFNASHYAISTTLPPGTLLPGNIQPGYIQPGYMQPGNTQPGNVPLNNIPPSNTQTGNLQPVNVQPGAIQPGNAQPGNIPPGNTQTGNLQPANVQPGAMQPGNAQSGYVQPTTLRPASA